MSKPKQSLALRLQLRVRGVIPLRCAQVHVDRRRKQEKHKRDWRFEA